jgi:predicted metal-dependent phosphoesterase TrpH
MSTIYDLHSHSTASDGALSPTALVIRAAQQGVDVLALTDHDTTAGLAEARQAASELPLHLLNGIELSVTWNRHCFHVVGLGINPECPVLMAGINKIQATRRERTVKIVRLLEKKNIFGSYEAVSQVAGETGMVTRSHFADFLVKQQVVNSEQEAFEHFLADGKPAYVFTIWAELEEAVSWINQAGGVAVLAHPMRYKLTLSWLKRFLTAFKACGGAGIEVVTGRYHPDEVRRSAELAKQFSLAASVGSDFHTPKYPWLELGRIASLPETVEPIWGLLDG